MAPTKTTTKSKAAQRARRRRQREPAPAPQISPDLSPLEHVIATELLEDRDHLRGCPGGRVEAYAGRQPPRVDEYGHVTAGATDVTIARCVECGGTVVHEDPYEEVIAEIKEQLGLDDGGTQEAGNG